MADDPTKLVFTADTSNLSDGLKTVRGEIDDFTKRLGLSGDVGKRTGDLLEKSFTEIGLSAGETKEALSVVEQEHLANASAAQSHTASLKRLSEGFLGIVGIGAILRQNYIDLREELAPFVEELKQVYSEATGSSTGVELFTNMIEAMINPTTIAKNLIANFKIAWSEFEKGAGLSTEATGVLSEAIERLNERLEKHRQDVDDDKQSLKDRTDAIAVAIFTEERHGGVTAKSREEVEKLVKEYEKTGEIPPKLDRIRQSLGIMTEAEKDAGEEAKRRGEEQERASEKVKRALEREAEKRREAIAAEVESIEGSASALAERTQLFLDAVAAAEEDGVVTVEAQAKIQEKLRSLLEDFKRFGAEPPEEIQAVIDKYGELVVAGDQVADVQKRIQEEAKAAAAALQEQVDAATKAQGDAAKSVADTQARIAELEKKQGDGALTLSEDEELFELKRKLFEQQQALNDATAEAEAVTFDLEQAQADLGDEASRNAQIFADLEQGLITSEQAARLLVAGTEDAKKGLQDLYDEAAAAADGAGDATAAFDEAFSGAADAADEAGASIADAGEEGAAGIGQMERAAKGAGEAVEQLGRKGEEAAGRASFKTMREDVEWLEEHVPILTGLIADLEEAAARVELGGPDDGSSDEGEEATA